MTGWRVTVALILLAAVGVPAALPFVDLLSHGQAWQAWMEAGRLASLALNTLALVAGTLAVAMPLGMVAAILLYRTDLPLRRLLRFLTLLALFIPLPLFTSAWQIALGTGGWLPVAIWIHAIAGLPWIIILVGQGLRWVERELEEDALTVVGPWRVLWKVTLPRCRAAIFAAGLWVALLAVTEITVTDMMQVRTFAEETYTQFVMGDRDALARAVAVSLPVVLLCCGIVVAAARRWEQNLPPAETLWAPSLLFKLGKARWICLLAVLFLVGMIAGVPLASLVWKTGLSGHPQTWSAQTAASHLATALRVRGGMVGETLLIAGLSGFLTAGLALIVCWQAIGSRWFQTCILSLMAVVWALAGPVIGIGLKQMIAQVLDLTEWLLPGSRVGYGLTVALYYGPSPLPAIWAHFIRFFPCAIAVLWPVVRLLPHELRDAVRVDGARPRQEFWHLILPLTMPAGLRAGLAVAILSLGELGAGKLVDTPGSQTFAHEVFAQMHYGVTNDLAALCLILLAAVVLGGSLLGLWQNRLEKRRT